MRKFILNSLGFLVIIFFAIFVFTLDFEAFRFGFICGFTLTIFDLITEVTDI